MELIKKLRERTGAGIGDCKKALEEAGNDIDKAVEILRKKGIAKASKRSEREASEGVVRVSVNEMHNEGYIVEVNTETDFAARNDMFQELADRILEVVEEKKPTNLDELLTMDYEDDLTVKDAVDNLSGVVGEKMGIKRCDILTTGGTVADYTHMNGRIGVLASVDKINAWDLAYDIAMQVAATNPKYLAPEDVPAEEINKEKEIYREQLAKEGKPENIMEKIIEGKINKYYEEVCLLKQEYIKDDKKKVEDILGGAKIERFIRYSL